MRFFVALRSTQLHSLPPVSTSGNVWTVDTATPGRRQLKDSWSHDPTANDRNQGHGGNVYYFVLNLSE